jgi:ferrochelatase
VKLVSIRTKIILAQLGSPASPSKKDVKIYLKRFLLSRRVVDVPRFIWWFVLNFFILPFRAKTSANKYSKIWDGNEFPLVKYSNSFAKKLENHLKKKVDDLVEVIPVYLLPENGFQRIKISGERERLIIIPMFPQFSTSSSMLVLDAFYNIFSKRGRVPRFEFISSFHESFEFISSCANKIENELQSIEVDHLLLSFHGIPEIRVTAKGDPYLTHCQKTFELLKNELMKRSILKEDSISISFQSRFGLGKWLKPSTVNESLRIVALGKKNIVLFSPSFVVDCLETIEELGLDLKKQIEQVGGTVTLISSLNDDDEWCERFASFLVKKLC